MNAAIAELERELMELKQRLNRARREIGPEPVRDYDFLDPSAGKVSLSSLFGGKRDLLVVHNMGHSCRYCALWADGFIGLWKHISQRASFVLTSPDAPDTVARFAAHRGWRFPCVSTKGSTFAADMGYEPTPGDRRPGLSAFWINDSGQMVRTGHTPFGPGDDFCGVFPMFELLHDGAAGWKPSDDGFAPLVRLGLDRAAGQ